MAWETALSFFFANYRCTLSIGLSRARLDRIIKGHKLYSSSISASIQQRPLGRALCSVLAAVECGRVRYPSNHVLGELHLCCVLLMHVHDKNWHCSSKLGELVRIRERIKKCAPLTDSTPSWAAQCCDWLNSPQHNAASEPCLWSINFDRTIMNRPAFMDCLL